ncbi:MAG: pyrimidine dimer DNA glycosylase/endonuclease V [Bacteroidales bacterium]
MRIWSIHPKYLDAKGLVSLWREALLAKNVLEGRTIGYKNHPQLIRFKNSDAPLSYINQYLSAVYDESLHRVYHFNFDKFNKADESLTMKVSQGQIEYEKTHLLKKLKTRDTAKYNSLMKETSIEPHPLFIITEGEIEEWEIV